MTEDGTIDIRSFRVCFRLERRIHRLERWRIPLPYGLPVRGLVYGVAILLAVLIAGRLPVLSSLLDLVHPIIRYGALPIGGGYVLTELRLDGRTGHAVARSWLRMQVEPRRLIAFRPDRTPKRVRFGSVAVAPDGRGARLRRGVVEGEGRIVLATPATTAVRRRTLRVTPRRDGDREPGARTVRLRAGQRVAVG